MVAAASGHVAPSTRFLTRTARSPSRAVRFSAVEREVTRPPGADRHEWGGGSVREPRGRREEASCPEVALDRACRAA